MPVDWKKYAADWKVIAKAKKASVGWKCEDCGKQCRKPEEQFDTHRRTLTVHHIDGDPGNNAPENLIALCPRCHLMRHRKDSGVRGDGTAGRSSCDAGGQFPSAFASGEPSPRWKEE